MKRPTQQWSAVPAPAFSALVVAPAIGGIVMMFVSIGLAAMTLGAWSGFGGHHRHRRLHRSRLRAARS